MSPDVDYWLERARRQGPTYVAKAGKQDSYRRQMKALTPYLDHLTGRVLDFGCGPGRFQGPVEERGCVWEGVDLIPHYGSMEVGDIQPGSFQSALAIFVLQHIVDEDRYVEAVDTIHEALAPGGVLLVVDHQPAGDFPDHMEPRGPGRLWQDWPWSTFQLLGSWNNHWIGKLVR